MTAKQALGIFARTFLVGVGSLLLVVRTLEWQDPTLLDDNALIVGLGLLAAAIMAATAVGIAYTRFGPAGTPLEKAVRTLIERVVGGVGVVAFSAWQDVVAFGDLLLPLGIAGVFDFLITLATVQPAPPDELPPSNA